MPRTLAKSVNHLAHLYTRKPMAERVDMSGRNVIVTGASPNSLGYETARILASWGATVIATSRHNVSLMESSLKDDLCTTGTDGNTLSTHRLDLSDVDSVNRFATWYRKHHGGNLHALINNAGIHRNIFKPRRKPPLTRDGFEIHWRTNYLGAFHLTNVLLPLLKQGGLESGNARVINVASHLHDRVGNKDLFHESKRYHSWDAYGRSKLALIHHSFEIERRFSKPYNLQSVTVHPGSVNTNLTQMKPPQGKVKKTLHRINASLAPLVLLPSNYGAQTIVMCASKQPLQGGAYYYRCTIAEPTDDSKDETASKLLWDQTQAWVETLAKPEWSEHEQV